jgi:D-alanyl-D-alanine carboxypeptidase/D-alanyl-D-alanine-endopeptidase (penicillin-binding protein 4)
MARQLYLSIAADQAGAPATTDKAQSAIKAWLATKGLAFPELVIENGAGLSRIDRISAQNLTTLLLAAFRSPVMPELAASLPLVAVDGTMRRRLKNGSIAGQAHIKTGSLADVRAISGYALDRNGRRYALTMIVNHPNAQRAQPAQDALLNWIYAR